LCRAQIESVYRLGTLDGPKNGSHMLPTREKKKKKKEIIQPVQVFNYDDLGATQKGCITALFNVGVHRKKKIVSKCILFA